MFSAVDIAYYKSPIGTLEVKGSLKGVSSVYFIEKDIQTTVGDNCCESVKDCVVQLEEYFNKERASFELTIHFKGTKFQKSVWKYLLEIPYGKTKTYLEQSKALGDVKAIRAVASANGKNPFTIILPCHRVIGSDGSLTGYAGGVSRKKWLLEHEGAISKQISLF